MYYFVTEKIVGQSTVMTMEVWYCTVMRLFNSLTILGFEDGAAHRKLLTFLHKKVDNIFLSESTFKIQFLSLLFYI